MATPVRATVRGGGDSPHRLGNALTGEGPQRPHPYQELQIHPPQQRTLLAILAPHSALEKAPDAVRQATLWECGMDLSAIYPARHTHYISGNEGYQGVGQGCVGGRGDHGAKGEEGESSCGL